METLQFILTNIIFPLVVTFIGIYVFPRIEFYLQNRSLSSRQRKLKALLKKYRNVRIVRDTEMAMLPVYILRNMSKGLYKLTLFITVIGIFTTVPKTNAILNSIMVSIMAVSGFNVYQTFRRLWQITNDLTSFNEFKEKTKKQLVKLGGNPEDLDKEATQGG